MSALWDMIKGRFATIPELGQHDLSGKVVIVTGANVGLGLEAARHLARFKPAKLILACRNPDKALAAVQDLKATTGLESIEAQQLDLASFDSVRSFAKQVQTGEERLDILVNNAGVGSFKWILTKDGWETMLQVNVLSTFLLTLLLLPKMTMTASTYSTKSRIVIVSSDTHTWIPDIPLTERLLSEANDKALVDAAARTKDKAVGSLSLPNRYAFTKLLEIILVEQLAKKCPSDVLINTMNPGFCHSALRREYTGPIAAINYVVEIIFCRPTEVGGRLMAHCAISEDAGQRSGRYWQNGVDFEPAPLVISSKGQEEGIKLYNEIIDVLQKIDGSVTAGLK